jgi:hypothetical protein
MEDMRQLDADFASNHPAYWWQVSTPRVRITSHSRKIQRGPAPKVIFAPKDLTSIRIKLMLTVGAQLISYKAFLLSSEV